MIDRICQLKSTLIVGLLLSIPNSAAAQESVDFEKQVRPLLIQHCSECHGGKVQKSGLRLDVRHTALKGGDGGEVIVAGKSDSSELIRRIVSKDDDRMPPEGPPVPDEAVLTLRQWIDSGANWPENDVDRAALRDPRKDHWSFQPLSVPRVPNTDELAKSLNAESQNEIDRFVLQKLHEQGLRPNARADRRTLIRRATLDLTGLPPAPERVEAFVNDDRDNAWSELLNELLESPRYGERWAQHWLDVVRYADTHGFEVNTPRDNAWHYRDYVIRSLNEDKPYDQFVREQIAGDVFGADAATGFLVASAVLLPGQIGADDESKRLARQDALDEIIVGTSNTILGLTIGCARCHDHKFDPITMQDYYSLQSFFAGVEYGDRPMRDSEQSKREQTVAEIGQRITELKSDLQQFETRAFSGRTMLIDEEDHRFVTWLKKENGPGANPEGTSRGYRDDPGSADQMPNISRGRYTWWNNVSGEDVMTYNPAASGRFRLWLSWGAHGSGVHTRDARYVLDRDGDLATRDDQTELGEIDQYYQAGVSTGETEQRPLWSGLHYVGEVELSEQSRIVVRGGETGTGITADVIVLQETNSTQDQVPNRSESSPQPVLRAPVSAGMNTELFEPIEARFVRMTTFETINDNQHEPCVDEFEIYSPQHGDRNLALASNGTKPTSSGNYSDIGIHQLKHINDGLYGNSQSWISNERGGGWVQLELPQTVQIDRIVWSRDREGKFVDRLPIRYEIAVSTDGNTWNVVASHRDRVPLATPFDAVQALVRNSRDSNAVDLQSKAAKLNELQKEKTRLESPVMVFAGTFREPDRTFVLRRGNPEQRLDETHPHVPAVFVSSESESAADRVGASSVESKLSTTSLTEEQQRRLSLANWLASPKNPLTARVMVNRIWQNHFGRGLVDTANDFGINGAQPSHPELLDWLAAEFIRSGWSIKHLHRLIMTSATYQQSSHIDRDCSEKDRDNVHLWRFTSRRLESETVRDSILAVTGELNLQMYGRGFDFFESRGGLNGFPPREQFTAAELRRMIYSHKVRMEKVPVFGAFDCPDAGQSMPRRSRSTTALQALNLFNSQFVLERSERLAQRITNEFPSSKADQIDRLFLLTTGRRPVEEERTACVQVAEQHGLATVCRAVLNSSEFLFLP